MKGLSNDSQTFPIYQDSWPLQIQYSMLENIEDGWTTKTRPSGQKWEIFTILQVQIWAGLKRS